MEQSLVKICLMIFLFYVYWGDGASNTRDGLNKCYLAVNKTHEGLTKLIEDLNNKTSTSKVTKPFDVGKIDQLINKLKTVENGTQKIGLRLTNHTNEVKFQQDVVKSDEEIVKNMKNKLANISEISQQNTAAFAQINNMTKIAEKRYNEIKELLDVYKNVSDTCEKQHNASVELERTVNEIDENFKKIKNTYDKTKSRVEKINQDNQKIYTESVKNKNKVESLKLPSYALSNYLTEAEIKLNTSIIYLKENADILKELLADLYNKTREKIRRKIEKINNTVKEIQDDLSIMNEKLDEFDDGILRTNFTSTINNDTDILLKDIRKGIKNLENKMKSLKSTDEEKKLFSSSNTIKEQLEWVRNKLSLLKIYQLILDTLPSELQLRDIEEELKKLKMSIILMQQYLELKDSLEYLRKLRDEYVKSDCLQGWSPV